jgi:penicillin-binding protein-related factor A (putative recombinase)
MIADRGKWAESEVEAVLKAWNDKYFAFAYLRLPDSRSARNYISAQIADFQMMFGGFFMPLEVKETEHDFLLKKDKIRQLALLRKWENAGAKALVVTYHSQIKVWRVANIGDLERGATSWDMRKRSQDFNTADAALRHAMQALGINLI